MTTGRPDHEIERVCNDLDETFVTLHKKIENVSVKLNRQPESYYHRTYFNCYLCGFRPKQ